GNALGLPVNSRNQSPARVAEGITVGASTITDAKASFSNFGTCVDLHEAGVDIELPDPDSFPLVLKLAREGKVSEGSIDKAVARNLRAKFLLGLFENPHVDPERAVRVTNSPEHREMAAEAARRSIVLLKNENNLLPLDRSKLRSIAVIGPTPTVHTSAATAMIQIAA
ncbi:MAG: hypothetical protein ACREBC_33405, partial [Pyrinomonadaceae bacterium]